MSFKLEISITKLAAILIFALPVSDTQASCEFMGPEILPAHPFIEKSSLRQLDDMAIDILEKVVTIKRPQQYEQEVADWATNLRQKQMLGGRLTQISVIEHTAVSYILKTGFFDKYAGSAPIKEILTDTLKLSWQHLASKTPETEAELLGRLPVSVLKEASREARMFHAASFQSQSVQAAQKELALGRDYVPRLKDGAISLGILSLAFSQTGSELLAATTMGYAISSIAEHALHRYVGHPNGRMQGLFKKAGAFGQAILNIAFSHGKVHHKKTFTKDFFNQFATQAEKDELDRELDDMGKIGQQIKDVRYGLTVSTDAVVLSLLVTAPVHGALVWAMGLGPAQAAALFAPTVLFPLASKYLHPFIHDRQEEALAEVGPIGKWFLQTRYVEMMARYHYGHHHEGQSGQSGGRGGNYNLLWGADWIFGQLRKPTIKQVIRMWRQELLGAHWL